jgi:cellulose synthase/poly-beta-1,6-N-acetylglucosamine synthase-like glycosyltransferase
MRAQAIALIVAFNWFVFFYFVVWNGTYLLFNVLAFLHLRRRGHEYHRRSMRKLFQSGFYEPVSVLIPAHNEAHAIVQTVRSALHLEYPEFEVVVVNDGSDDDTLAELTRVFELRPMARPIDPTLPSGPIRGVYVSRPFPNLVVVDKENAGKSDALNAGLRVARHPLFCSIDADSILERDCLLRVTRPFLDDERTIAPTAAGSSTARTPKSACRGARSGASRSSSTCARSSSAASGSRR